MNHREAYPEQYTHELVGKWVMLEDDYNNETGEAWQVRTVVSTQYGLLATQHNSNTAYSIDDLIEVAPQDADYNS